VTEQVIISQDGSVLEFLLNNPHAGNEISVAMFEQMMNVLREQTEAPSATLLRIRAKGDKFCMGRERSARTVNDIHDEAVRLVRFKQLLRNLPLVTIAQVEGDAAGFGFGLAILCDYAVVAREAQLYFPEMRFGLAPTAIMSYLAEYIPPRIAFHLVLTGEPIVPEVAAQIGLISEAVPSVQVQNRTNEIVTKILKLHAKGVRDCKVFFQQALQNNFEQNARLAIETLTLASVDLMARNSQ
jgi:methylglutaconyl-CoA hydratase